MTKIEYDNKMDEIESSYKKAKENLYIEYATGQRLFKIGDIITNKTVILKIKRFSISLTLGTPSPNYIGIGLRKDLKPKRNGTTEYIFGNTGVSLIK